MYKCILIREKERNNSVRIARSGNERKTIVGLTDGSCSNKNKSDFISSIKILMNYNMDKASGTIHYIELFSICRCSYVC